MPAGRYVLEELHAPEDYVRQGFEGVIRTDGDGNTFYEDEKTATWEASPSEQVIFHVNESQRSYDPVCKGYVTTVKQANEPVVGKISIHCEGEILTDVTGNNLFTAIADGISSLISFLTGDDDSDADSSTSTTVEAVNSLSANSLPDLTDDQIADKVKSKGYTDKEYQFVYETVPLFFILKDIYIYTNFL